ncbi:MAG: right-handed parallel beta-helix repeat-containing protein [Myxococcota bacterium]
MRTSWWRQCLGAGLWLGAMTLGCGGDTSADPSGGGAGDAGSGAGLGAGAGMASGRNGSGGGAGGEDAGPSACADGIDNDGDGYTDWQGDLGCWGAGDDTEEARPRAEEAGYTTFDIAADSVVVYVAADGDDTHDGSTPDLAVATLGRAVELVRDGENDFILMRRGDTWRDPVIPRRFLSGRDADHPMVIASYGDETDRPRLELDRPLINHDGQTRSFTAIMGLHLVQYPLDPEDPDFTGTGGAAFRYVGGGRNLLIEDCHLEYGEIVVQSFQDLKYDDVQIRRNVIERAYHRETCIDGNPNGNSAHRPSGTFTSKVDGLLIEGNLYDHNGWNKENVDSACATIFNHNMYLSGGEDIVVRDNVLTRASSIHIKLRADVSGAMKGLVIDNNVFVEGEIGVSLGGNTDAPYRFVNSTIENNVLSEIGRSRPTTRTLAWGMGLSDNDGVVIRQNLLLNQHEAGVGNSYALRIGGGTNRNVTVEDNLFYRIQNRALMVRSEANHDSITIADNHFVDPDQDSCLIDHDGSFGAYTYQNNRYHSSAASDRWFCVGGARESLTDWDEGGATADAGNFPDPSRTLETYAASLGLGSTLVDYLSVARTQSRLNHRPELGAPAINDYIRAGFGR